MALFPIQNVSFTARIWRASATQNRKKEELSSKTGEAPDTFEFMRLVVRAILSVRPKCSHRRVSLKESPLNPVLVLKNATRISTGQASMRTNWFKHIAI